MLRGGVFRGLWDCVKLQVNGIQVSIGASFQQKGFPPPLFRVLFGLEVSAYLSSAAQVPLPSTALLCCPSSSPHLSQASPEEESRRTWLPQNTAQSKCKGGKEIRAAPCSGLLCVLHVPLRTAGLRSGKLGCVALQPRHQASLRTSRPAHLGLHCLLLLTSHPQHPAVL